MISPYSSLRTIYLPRYLTTPISSLDPSNNFMSGLNARVRSTEAYILDGALGNDSPVSELLVNVTTEPDSSTDFTYSANNSSSSTTTDSENDDDSSPSFPTDGVLA